MLNFFSLAMALALDAAQLEPDPLYCDLSRFPSYETACIACSYLKAYEQRMKDEAGRCPWAHRRALLIMEASRAHQIWWLWDNVKIFQSATGGECYRRRWLIDTRERLSPEDWYYGRLPPLP